MILIMKKIMTFFVALVLMTVTLTSCCTSSAAVATSVETVEDVYTGTTVDYTFIIANGRPFYVDGVISYYFYNGIYYYPYIYNAVRCLHPYRYVQRRGYVHVPSRGYRPARRWMHRDDSHRFHHHNVPHHHRPIVQTNRGGSSRPNNGFHNGNGRTQGKPNRNTHNMRSRTHVKTGHGNAGSFNRTGSVGGRFQGGQGGGRR